MKKVVIVGGGIVGLAVAWKLAQSGRPCEIRLLDKEPVVGAHQSGHNSGVLHAGLYYKPGSLKARLAVAGIRQMTRFCIDHGIPHEICGKIVLATDETEQARLPALLERGTANGLQGLRMMGRDEILEREPHAGGGSALEVPEEGIVDYPAVCRELARQLEARGHEIRLNTEVAGLHRQPSGRVWKILADSQEWEAHYLINAAGLHCDRVCRLAGRRPGNRIVPFRGEYYKLKSRDGDALVRHLIYPVPDPRFPFLGVHFTRLIHGGVEAGPNAVLALAREGYRATDFNLRDAWETLTFPGFWKFAARHAGMCAREFRQSLSKKHFVRALQKLVPAVTADDLETGGAGVRAQAMSPAGGLVEDFDIVREKDALHILNAPSPAATASLAIADYLLEHTGDFQTS